MCGTEIKNGECSCGAWSSEEECQNNPMKKAIEAFNEMKRFTMTGEMPHLGCAVVFFRGDYADCKQIECFIHRMKGRPYYEELM